MRVNPQHEAEIMSQLRDLRSKREYIMKYPESIISSGGFDTSNPKRKREAKLAKLAVLSASSPLISSPTSSRFLSSSTSNISMDTDDESTSQADELSLPGSPSSSGAALPPPPPSSVNKRSSARVQGRKKHGIQQLMISRERSLSSSSDQINSGNSSAENSPRSGSYGSSFGIPASRLTSGMAGVEISSKDGSSRKWSSRTSLMDYSDNRGFVSEDDGIINEDDDDDEEEENMETCSSSSSSMTSESAYSSTSSNRMVTRAKSASLSRSKRAHTAPSKMPSFLRSASGLSSSTGSIPPPNPSSPSSPRPSSPRSSAASARSGSGGTPVRKTPGPQHRKSSPPMPTPPFPQRRITVTTMSQQQNSHASQSPSSPHDVSQGLPRKSAADSIFGSEESKFGSNASIFGHNPGRPGAHSGAQQGFCFHAAQREQYSSKHYSSHSPHHGSTHQREGSDDLDQHYFYFPSQQSHGSNSVPHHSQAQGRPYSQHAMGDHQSPQGQYIYHFNSSHSPRSLSDSSLSESHSGVTTASNTPLQTPRSGAYSSQRQFSSLRALEEISPNDIAHYAHMKTSTATFKPIPIMSTSNNGGSEDEKSLETNLMSSSPRERVSKNQSVGTSMQDTSSNSSMMAISHPDNRSSSIGEICDSMISPTSDASATSYSDSILPCLNSSNLNATHGGSNNSNYPRGSASWTRCGHCGNCVQMSMLSLDETSDPQNHLQHGITGQSSNHYLVASHLHCLSDEPQFLYHSQAPQMTVTASSPPDPTSSLLWFSSSSTIPGSGMLSSRSNSLSLPPINDQALWALSSSSGSDLWQFGEDSSSSSMFNAQSGSSMFGVSTILTTKESIFASSGSGFASSLTMPNQQQTSSLGDGASFSNNSASSSAATSGATTAKKSGQLTTQSSQSNTSSSGAQSNTSATAFSYSTSPQPILASWMPAKLGALTGNSSTLLNASPSSATSTSSSSSASNTPSVYSNQLEAKNSSMTQTQTPATQNKRISVDSSAEAFGSGSSSSFSATPISPSSSASFQAVSAHWNQQ